MFQKMRAIALVASGIWLAVALATPAIAFPDKPIKIVVPAAAGGGSDAIARILAPSLEASLGQPVIVVNVPGGGQSIGNRQVKESPADGYSLTLTHVALHIANALGQTDFGPEAFDPVAQVARDGLVLAVSSDAPWEDFEKFVEDAKSRPNEILAGANIGAFNHFGEIILAEEIGTEFRYMQTGGSAETIAALLGGHVDIGTSTASDVHQYVESGDLRVLVQMEEERHELLPDVPTTAEAGYPRAVLYANFYILAPVGTPPERLVMLSNAMEEAVNSRDVQEKFDARGIPLSFRPTGEELKSDIAAEHRTVLDAASAISGGQ